jgi:hypothetical protein
LRSIRYDQHAWRVLATARFVTHDDLGALDAWNRIGEPRADLIDIKGLRHTRYLVVSDAIGVRPKQLLTADAIRLAQKRVRDLPAVATARVSYHPTEEGTRADRRLRPRARSRAADLPGVARHRPPVRSRTAKRRSPSPTSAAVVDALTASWRWWQHRPMIGAAYAAPGPGGIWTIDASRETQTFGATAFEETRTRNRGERQQLDRTAGAGCRRSGNRALDRSRTTPRRSPAPWSSGLSSTDSRSRDVRPAWRGGGDPFGTAGRGGAIPIEDLGDGHVVAVRCRLPRRHRVVAGVRLAGGRHRACARCPPARAPVARRGNHHRRCVFGRRVSSAGAEVQHWIAPRTHPFRFAPAAFVDAARAMRGLPTTDTRIQVDAGIGVRLSLFGMGVLRIDAAHGLRDGP